MPKQTQEPGKLHTGPHYQRATLLVNVHDRGPDDTSFRDGDIINAFSWNQTRKTHAEQICHVKQMQGGPGLRRPATEWRRLAWFENTYEFRLERIPGDNVNIRRVKLADMTTEDIEFGVPITEWFDAKIQHPQHRVFGTSGDEIFYTGKQDFSESAIDAAWAYMEANTGFAEADHNFRELGADEAKFHLHLTVDDMDDATASDLQQSELDGAGEIIKKRKWSLNWRAINGMTASVQAQVVDTGFSMDLTQSGIKHPHKLFASLKS